MGNLSKMESENETFKNTLQPIVTGQSVLAVCYKDGVMMIADTQCNFLLNELKMKHYRFLYYCSILW
jgi:20S proteasome alpha/beta subunit